MCIFSFPFLRLCFFFSSLVFFHSYVIFLFPLLIVFSCLCHDSPYLYFFIVFPSPSVSIISSLPDIVFLFSCLLFFYQHRYTSLLLYPRFVYLVPSVAPLVFLPAHSSFHSSFANSQDLPFSLFVFPVPHLPFFLSFFLVLFSFLSPSSSMPVPSSRIGSCRDVAIWRLPLRPRPN